MKQKIFLILLFFASINFTFSQVIDRYGVNIGSTYATQNWEYSNSFFVSYKTYKFGLQTFASAEKDLFKFMRLRAELGYVQKGFKETNELVFVDGSNAGVAKSKVNLHDLAINLGLKIQPFKWKFAPYLLAGIRSDYLIGYRDILITEPGSEKNFKLYSYQIEKFNKLNLGALVGLGMDVHDRFYVEFEFNPTFTYNYNNTNLRIQDKCFGAKVGIYLNQFIK